MGKLRIDGIPKRSGLREGDRRVGRALSLMLQVIDEYRPATETEGQRPLLRTSPGDCEAV